MRSVDRQRRNYHVDARSISETGINHGRRLIDVPANARNDLVNDVHQVSIVLEANVGLFQNTGTFYIDLLMPIHQDVVDSRILQKRLQRPQPEDLVQNFQRESLSFTTAQGRLKVGDQILNHCQCLAASTLVAHGCNFFHVDLIQKIAMNTRFEFLINLKIQTCSFPVIGDGDSHDSTRRNDMIQITHDPPYLLVKTQRFQNPSSPRPSFFLSSAPTFLPIPAAQSCKLRATSEVESWPVASPPLMVFTTCRY